MTSGGGGGGVGGWVGRRLSVVRISGLKDIQSLQLQIQVLVFTPYPEPMVIQWRKNLSTETKFEY